MRFCFGLAYLTVVIHLYKGISGTVSYGLTYVTPVCWGVVGIETVVGNLYIGWSLRYIMPNPAEVRAASKARSRMRNRVKNRKSRAIQIHCYGVAPSDVVKDWV